MATKWKSIVRQLLLWAAVIAILATTVLSCKEAIDVAEHVRSLEESTPQINYDLEEAVTRDVSFEDSKTYQSLCQFVMGYYAGEVLMEEGIIKVDDEHEYLEPEEQLVERATVTAKIHYKKDAKKKDQTFSYHKGKYEEVKDSADTAPNRVSNTYYARCVQGKDVEGYWNEETQKSENRTYYYMEGNIFSDARMAKLLREGAYYTSLKKKTDIDCIEMKIIMDPELVAETYNHWVDWKALVKNDIRYFEIYAAIMLISCLLILICASPKDRTRVGSWVDSIYLEIHWFIFFVFFCCSVGCAVAGVASWDEGLTENFMELAVFGMLVFELAGLYMIISGVRKLKDHYYFRSSIVYKLAAGTGNVIKNQTRQWNELRGKEASTLRIREKELKRKRNTLILYAVGVVAVTFLFLCLVGVDGAFFLLGVAFVVPMLWLFVRLFKDYRMSIQDMLDFEKVLLQIDEIASGDLDAKTDIGEESLYYAATKNLEGIGQGLENSMQEQMKSERMKVDLITNVSHDLKTPLTSIIGYIDLLSKDETLSEESRDYVSILEKKSERLRNIVTDLFDLAKSTSGNVDLNLTSIDFRRLVQQTLAEMSDTIEESGFAIVEKYDAEPTMIMADADRMYRVIQNIMDNALKYSLTGSRIFVSLKDIGTDEIRLEVINTASYQMDFDEEEITERFRRGDEARSTEGSGLGLSIADSFTKLSGGNLEVHTRGDQFVVEITFKKIMK